MHTYIQVHIYIHINTHTYILYMYIYVYICVCVLCIHTHHTHPNDQNLELVCFTDSGLYHCALHCQTPTDLALSLTYASSVLGSFTFQSSMTFSPDPFATHSLSAWAQTSPSQWGLSWLPKLQRLHAFSLTRHSPGPLSPCELPPLAYVILSPSTYNVLAPLKGWRLSSSLHSPSQSGTMASANPASGWIRPSVYTGSFRIWHHRGFWSLH